MRFLPCTGEHFTLKRETELRVSDLVRLQHQNNLSLGPIRAICRVTLQPWNGLQLVVAQHTPQLRTF